MTRKEARAWLHHVLHSDNPAAVNLVNGRLVLQDGYRIRSDSQQQETPTTVNSAAPRESQETRESTTTNAAAQQDQPASTTVATAVAAPRQSQDRQTQATEGQNTTVPAMSTPAAPASPDIMTVPKEEQYAYRFPPKKPFTAPPDVRRSRIDSLRIEAPTRKNQNLNRARKDWDKAREKALEKGLNIANIDDMIEDNDTPASAIFKPSDYTKWIFYEGTSDPKLREEYRLNAGRHIVNRLVSGDLEPLAYNDPAESNKRLKLTHNAASASTGSSSSTKGKTVDRGKGKAKSDDKNEQKARQLHEARMEMVKGDYVTIVSKMHADDPDVQDMCRRLRDMTCGFYASAPVFYTEHEEHALDEFEHQFAEATADGNPAELFAIQYKIWNIDCRRMLFASSWSDENEALFPPAE